MIFYLDASVWLKRYVIESGSKRVRRWVAQGPILAASPLGLIEVLATLSRKERAGELATEDMHAQMASAEKDYERLAVIPLDVTTPVARQLPARYGLRGADTLHLASILWMRDRPSLDEDVALVTSDRELAEAAEAAGLDVFDPTRDALPAP